MFPGIYYLVSLFTPLIDLIVSDRKSSIFKLLKTKGIFYFFLLVIAFILARVLFLVWIELLGAALKTAYSFADYQLGFIFLLSSSSYWLFISKIMKLNDNTALFTIMYVAEIFWTIIFSVLVCLLLSLFLSI